MSQPFPLLLPSISPRRDQSCGLPPNCQCLPVSGGYALTVTLVWALIFAGISTFLFLKQDILH